METLVCQSLAPIKLMLINLPGELLLEIADNLDPVSAVCLSLCCRFTYLRLHSTYPGRSLIVHPENPGDTIYRRRPCLQLQLIQRLERELPDYVACHRCETLHAIRNIQRYIDSSRKSDDQNSCIYDKYLIRPLRALCDPFDPVPSLSFAFSAIQMTMKLYRQKGPKNMKPTLERFTRNIMILGRNRGQVWRAVYTSQVRIANGCFLLRLQEAHAFPSYRKENIYEQKEVQKGKGEEDRKKKEQNDNVQKEGGGEEKGEALPIQSSWQTYICKHCGVLRQNDFYNQYLKIEVTYPHGLWHPSNKFPGLVGELNQCMACCTEYRIEWKDVSPLSASSTEKKQKILVVTRWINMGRGKNPFNDRKWRSSTEKSYYDSNIADTYDWEEEFYEINIRKKILPGMQPPSVCKAFEGAAYEGFDAGSFLTKEHLEHLFGNEKKPTSPIVSVDTSPRESVLKSR